MFLPGVVSRPYHEGKRSSQHLVVDRQRHVEREIPAQMVLQIAGKGEYRPRGIQVSLVFVDNPPVHSPSGSNTGAPMATPSGFPARRAGWKVPVKDRCPKQGAGRTYRKAASSRSSPRRSRKEAGAGCGRTRKALGSAKKQKMAIDCPSVPTGSGPSLLGKGDGNPSGPHVPPKRRRSPSARRFRPYGNRRPKRSPSAGRPPIQGSRSPRLSLRNRSVPRASRSMQAEPPARTGMPEPQAFLGPVPTRRPRCISKSHPGYRLSRKARGQRHLPPGRQETGWSLSHRAGKSPSYRGKWGCSCFGQDLGPDVPPATGQPDEESQGHASIPETQDARTPGSHARTTVAGQDGNRLAGYHRLHPWRATRAYSLQGIRPAATYPPAPR